MLNSIHFLGINSSYQTKESKQTSKVHSQPKCDTFVKTLTPFEKAYAESKKKIQNAIKNSNCEYSIVLDSDGKISDENMGSEHSCKVDSRKVAPGSVLMHGHPKRLPLSSGDVAILLATDAKSEEAIMADGAISKLTKTVPFKEPQSYGSLYEQLERKLCLMALDDLGINYKVTKRDVMDIFCDYTSKDRNTDEEEILKSMKQYGIDISAPLDEMDKQVRELCYFQLITNPNRYNKEHATIMENYSLIGDYLSADEGLELRHRFLEEIASDYGLIYETTLKRKQD